jgi:hypothetical protein
VRNRQKEFVLTAVLMLNEARVMGCGLWVVAVTSVSEKHSVTTQMQAWRRSSEQQVLLEIFYLPPI